MTNPQLTIEAPAHGEFRPGLRSFVYGFEFRTQRGRE